MIFFNPDVHTDWNGFTNSPHQWYECGLNETNCSLWSTDDTGLFYTPKGPYNEARGHALISIEDDLKTSKGWNESPYIFVIGQEGYSADWVTHRDNIYGWDGIFSDHPRFTPYFWWFGAVLQIEKYTHATEELVPSSDKIITHMFDCLLGLPRVHRQYVYDYIKSRPALHERILLSYATTHVYTDWVKGNARDDNFVPGKRYQTYKFKPADDPYGADDEISACCFLPHEIYNRTFYSIVAETHHDRASLTEKIAKPMLAERLFIVIGAPGILKGLRSIGFKTFSNVIDESYDDEPNDEKRWSMAMEQVEHLTTQHPEDIERIVALTVQHNKQWLIDNHDWSVLNAQIKSIAHSMEL